MNYELGMDNIKRNILKDKSFEFALAIVKLYKKLTEEKEYIMSKQLLRSGTAIGAMVRESQNAESKPDFIQKLGIAQKECDETLYWLELLYRAKYIEEPFFINIHSGATEILKIIKSIIITMKSQNQKK